MTACWGTGRASPQKALADATVGPLPAQPASAATTTPANQINQADLALPPRIQWSNAALTRSVPGSAVSTAVPRNGLQIPVMYTIIMIDTDSPFGTGNGRPFGAPVNQQVSNNNFAIAIDVDVCGPNLRRNTWGAVGLPSFGYQMSGQNANTVLPYLAPAPPGPI